MIFSQPKISPKPLFVVYSQDEDCVTGYCWSSVWPTKKQAMADAKKYSVGKTIIYLMDLADGHRYPPDTHILVCPQPNLIR